MSQDYTRPWGFIDQQNKQAPYSVEGGQENMQLQDNVECVLVIELQGAQENPALRVRTPSFRFKSFPKASPHRIASTRL